MAVVRRQTTVAKRAKNVVYLRSDSKSDIAHALQSTRICSSGGTKETGFYPDRYEGTGVTEPVKNALYFGDSLLMIGGNVQHHQGKPVTAVHGLQPTKGQINSTPLGCFSKYETVFLCVP